MQYTLPQQIKFGTTVHGTFTEVFLFDQLETIDVSLGRTIAPSQGEFGTRQRQRRKAFGQDLSDACTLLTKEATHMHHQMNRASTGGKAA